MISEEVYDDLVDELSDLRQLKKAVEEFAFKVGDHRSDVAEILNAILEGQDPRDIESRHSEFRVVCEACGKSNFVQYDTLTTLLEPIRLDPETGETKVCMDDACEAVYAGTRKPKDWI